VEMVRRYAGRPCRLVGTAVSTLPLLGA
jgi:hypothetical protein